MRIQGRFIENLARACNYMQLVDADLTQLPAGAPVAVCELERERS